MKTESEKSKKKSKEEKLNNKVKRSAEDDEKIERKKKKLKKEKKTNKEEPLSKNVEEDGNIESGENNESGQTEVKKKEPSKKQLKREKAELRAATDKEKRSKEAAQKALNYISQWKHAKSQWKFHKVTQIWLIDNLLSEKYVSDEHFPTIIEYFEGSKGAARKVLINKAMAAIKEVEDGIEEDEEFVETTKYKRARHLMQALPTET